MSASVTPRSPETAGDRTTVSRKEKNPMPRKPETKASGKDVSALTAFNLQDLLKAVEGLETLSVTRRRDLRSSVKRVASLLGEDPVRIPLHCLSSVASWRR